MIKSLQSLCKVYLFGYHEKLSLILEELISKMIVFKFDKNDFEVSKESVSMASLRTNLAYYQPSPPYRITFPENIIFILHQV